MRLELAFALSVILTFSRSCLFASTSTFGFRCCSSSVGGDVVVDSDIGRIQRGARIYCSVLIVITVVFVVAVVAVIL